MAIPVSRLPEELFREVRARKWTAFLVFVLVSAVVLLLGFVWPYRYQAEVIIFVDDKNIIRPLMEGSAVTTEINDRASAAKELLWGRKILEKIVTDTSVWGEKAATLSSDEKEILVAQLRTHTRVIPRGDSFFSIAYNANVPRETFLVAQRLGQVFIDETNRQKKAESRSAYDFVDKQVKSYEAQLKSTEDRLKLFMSENVDGTEQEVIGKLAQLRGRIELAQIEIREAEARRDSLHGQLGSVSRTLRQERTEDQSQRRIFALQDQLDSLRLMYHDTYPDIVSLREQIRELEEQQDQKTGKPRRMISQGEEIANPVYQELRTELAKAQTDIDTFKTRLVSLNALLQTEAGRMERIQANKAQLAELTRDMEVNTAIYNDLLKRREKARVSMHLDIEGQGLAYRLHEPAQFPISAVGPRFYHFAAAGLLVGLLAPFGLIAGLLQIDPRVRSEEAITDYIGLPVLGIIPEVRTPFERRKDRRRTLAIGVLVVLVISLYIAVVIGHAMGWLA